MYSCPSDDIHSIYLDNELPLAYLKEYEAHLQTCKSCAEKLEFLRKTKQIFQDDNKSMEFSNDFMEKGFERLQTKMHYANNVRKENDHRFPIEVAKWGIAVAAVVVAAIVPVGISNSSRTHNMHTNQVASIAPVARPQKNVPISDKQSVVLQGNLDYSSAYGIPVGTASQNLAGYQRVSRNSNEFRPPRPPMHKRDLSTILTNVDVLRPDFDEPNKISIKINVPGLENESDSIVIKLPVNIMPDSLSE